MKNTSLPIGFEKLKTEKPYINLGKLPEGEHKFRIVSRPIAGWIDWMDRKPCRFRPEDKPKSSFDPEKQVKPFWAMHVWDYSREGLFVMEVTQKGIQKSLESYAINEDWGDLTSYDIKIKKEGSGIETEYTVIPVPHKPLPKNAQEAVEGSKIRLEALYEGKDPWADLEPSGEELDHKHLSKEQWDKLISFLSQLESEKIEEFICKRAGIQSVNDLPQDKFEGVIAYLEKQVEIKNSKGGERDSGAA